MSRQDIYRNIRRDIVRSQTMSGDYSNAVPSSRGSGSNTNYSFRQDAPIGRLPETSAPAPVRWNIPNSGARRDFSGNPDFLQFNSLKKAADAISGGVHRTINTYTRNRMNVERIKASDARSEERQARAAERETFSEGRRTRQAGAHERLNAREQRLSEREQRLRDQEDRLQAREGARRSKAEESDAEDSGPSVTPRGGLGEIAGAVHEVAGAVHDVTGTVKNVTRVASKVVPSTRVSVRAKADVKATDSGSGEGSGDPSADQGDNPPDPNESFDSETARIRSETLRQFYPGSSVVSSTDKRRGNSPKGDV